MTTMMNFTLSSALQAELKTFLNPYVYALEYAGGQFVGSVNTLASPGNIPSGPVSISLPSSFSSGQVYVLIQPNGDGTLGTTISTANSGNVNAITVQSAQQYGGFKYQLLEATLSGSTGDLGDISSVNTFGIPVTFSNSNGARGFAPGFISNDFTSKLPSGSVLTTAAGLAVGPAQGSSLTPNPWPTSNWSSYVDALKTATDTLSKITIVTAYNDPKQTVFPATLSQYGVQYDSTNDYFVMVPNTTNGATNTDYVRISTANLLKSIYAQLGPIETSPNGKSGTWTVQPTTTPNSPDGQVAKYFVAGFDAGYWGATAHAPNPRDPTQIDLNKTANWNFNYAYGGAFNPVGTTAVAVTNPVSGGFYDSWAKDIQLNSNSYGWSYGDLISQGGTNPQLSLWDATKKQQVQNIDITLYSNSEPMPSTSGFQGVPPSYVAPTGSNYMPVNTPINVANNNNANLISVNFTVSAGSLSVNPDAQTPAFFKFYAPHDTQAGSDGFVSLSLTATGSDWSNFNVVGTPGNWKLHSFSANSPGNFNIYNMPVTSDGSTGWYQIVFGDASRGEATTYNFYAKSDSSGHFLDISSNPNNFVTDHGLGYGPGLGTAWMTGLAPGQTGYVLTLAPSGVMTYNIATLSAPGTIFGTSGNDILNGTLGSDIINGAPGNDSIAGGAGTDTAWSWEPSKNFALTTTAGSNNIALRDKVGTDGTDTLASIERVHFSDFTLDASTITKTAALPVDQIMKVVDLYTAGLNRAPDAVGLNYWASRLADGTSISDISKAIFSSAEAMPLYSAANSNPTLVNFAYLTAFGRAPDAAGAAYWTNELNTGHLQRTDIVTALVAGARAPGGGVLDAQYIANKEAVGAHFALTQGLNNPVWARTVETNVNGTAASVTAANAQTDAFAATAATAASTELVVQILGLVP